MGKEFEGDERYTIAMHALLAAMQRMKKPGGSGLDLSHLEDVPDEVRENLLYVMRHMSVNGRMQAAGYTKEDALLYILLDAMKASGREYGYSEEDSEWFENVGRILK